MNLNRIAAPMSGLLLMLVALIVPITFVSQGYEVILPMVESDCSIIADGLTIAVNGKADGTAQINIDSPVDLARLHRALKSIFRTRAEKLIFVRQSQICPGSNS